MSPEAAPLSPAASSGDRNQPPRTNVESIVMTTIDTTPHATPEIGTKGVKRGLAEMLKGGVIMDVVTAE